MSRTKTRWTSIDALRKYTQRGGKAGDRHRIVLFMHDADTQATYTRRRISEETGIPVNIVSGRVNTLIAEGILIEADDPVACPVSGNTVHRIQYNHAYTGHQY